MISECCHGVDSQVERRTIKVHISFHCWIFLHPAVRGVLGRKGPAEYIDWRHGLFVQQREVQVRQSLLTTLPTSHWALSSECMRRRMRGRSSHTEFLGSQLTATVAAISVGATWTGTWVWPAWRRRGRRRERTPDKVINLSTVIWAQSSRRRQWKLNLFLLEINLTEPVNWGGVEKSDGKAMLATTPSPVRPQWSRPAGRTAEWAESPSVTRRRCLAPAERSTVLTMGTWYSHQQSQQCSTTPYCPLYDSQA